MSRRTATVGRGALLFLLAACSVEPVGLPERTFDASAGEATVVIGGDGFVELDGVRMPVEKAVLELRFRMRAMAGDDRERRYVVHLRIVPPDSPVAERQTAEAHQFLCTQLQVMGVKQSTIDMQVTAR
jgi:hypothetical protein